MTLGWTKIGKAMPADRWVYNVVCNKILQWINSQPIDKWKLYDTPENSMQSVPVSALYGQNYIFTDEMEAWFLLRWS